MTTTAWSQTGQEAPENYPGEWIEWATLRDGAQVLLRPIRPDDAPRLQHGFTHLSPESIYLRFLETFKALSDQQAENFANVDYQNRMAFVASIQEDGQEHLIGVARYSKVSSAEPALAESAVVVIDEYQGRGLGTLLLIRLVEYARAHGVTVLLATVHYTNARILRFIQRSGFPFQRKILEPGVWEIRIFLQPKTGN
jgi:RimJ/RimL family protein N-acetyltransferase